MTAIGLRSGALFDLFGEGTEGLTREVLALGLERECRWARQTPTPWSVAEHLVVVSEVLRRDGAPTELQLAGLLHDVEEAILGDVPTPLKGALRVVLPDGSVGDYVEALERPVRARCCEALGLGWVAPLCETLAVAEADRLVLDAERTAMRHFTCHVAPMAARRSMRWGHAEKDITTRLRWRVSGAEGPAGAIWLARLDHLVAQCQAEGA